MSAVAGANAAVHGVSDLREDRPQRRSDRIASTGARAQLDDLSDSVVMPVGSKKTKAGGRSLTAAEDLMIEYDDVEGLVDNIGILGALVAMTALGLVLGISQAEFLAADKAYLAASE